MWVNFGSVANETCARAYEDALRREHRNGTAFAILIIIYYRREGLKKRVIYPVQCFNN